MQEELSDSLMRAPGWNRTEAECLVRDGVPYRNPPPSVHLPRKRGLSHSQEPRMERRKWKQKQNLLWGGCPYPLLRYASIARRNTHINVTEKR